MSQPKYIAIRRARPTSRSARWSRTLRPRSRPSARPSARASCKCSGFRILGGNLGQKTEQRVWQENWKKQRTSLAFSVLKKISDRVLNCSQQTLTRSSPLWKNNNMLLSSQQDRKTRYARENSNFKTMALPKAFWLCCVLNNWTVR